MTAADSVAYASLAAGVICFLMYVGLTGLAAVASLRKPVTSEKHPKAPHTGAAAALVPDIGEATDLLKAVAQLSDSLSKATPSLVALIGSILFLLVASIASGALHGRPPSPPPNPAATPAAPEAAGRPVTEPKT